MTHPDLIGAMLANTDDETQAEVLNEFVSVLGALCKPHEFSNIGMQAYYIAKRLKPATIEFFREMIGSYEHLRASLPAEVTSLHEQRDVLSREIASLKRERDTL